MIVTKEVKNDLGFEPTELEKIRAQQVRALSEDLARAIVTAARDLIDAVERYSRQECLRSELLARKDNLKRILRYEE